MTAPSTLAAGPRLDPGSPGWLRLMTASRSPPPPSRPDQNLNRRRWSQTSRHRETCAKGYNDFKDYGSGRVCRPCYNEKQRARRAAKRQAVSA